MTVTCHIRLITPVDHQSQEAFVILAVFKDKSGTIGIRDEYTGRDGPIPKPGAHHLSAEVPVADRTVPEVSMSGGQACRN